MIANSVNTLQTSKNPDELVAAALSLARGSDAEGHAALTKQFQSAEFYDRLDSNEAYGDFGSPLELNRILLALAENKSESAVKVLIGLSQSSVYLAVNRRITMLITACAGLRPAPPEIVRFWDAYSQPEKGFVPRTVSALVVNGSPPALALLEKKMGDPRYESEDQIDWLHGPILEHRSDAPLLASCLRMLKGQMPDELRPALVETLFDYRPQEWFPGKRSVVPAPPPPGKISREAVVQMRSIGEYALKNVKLSDDLRKAIEQYLKDTTKL